MSDDGAIAEADAPTRKPLEAAKRLVELYREKKDLAADAKKVQAEINRISMGDDSELVLAIFADDFQESSRVDGASVFLWRQIWASPAKDDDGEADHARLTAVLDGLGLDHLRPDKVNTQSLSAYVREQIEDAPIFNDDGEALTLEQRARAVLDGSLVDALNLTEKREVHVTGA